jgi:hypothetical protein
MLEIVLPIAFSTGFIALLIIPVKIHKKRIEFLAGLKKDMKVQYRGDIHSIKAVHPFDHCVTLFGIDGYVPFSEIKEV